MALGLVLGWAALSSLWLVLRKKAGLGRPVACALLAALVVGGVWWAQPPWDRGLVSHAREIELPGNLGRFAAVQAVRPDERMGPFDWSRSPSWALPLWLEGQPSGWLTQSIDPDRVALAAFLPALQRTGQYQIRWDQGLRWFHRVNGVWAPREEGPPELAGEVSWLSSLASERPDLRWSVGLEGVVCWLRPETGVGL